MAKLNRETLEAEFRKLPNQVAVAVVARVAMRVLPVLADGRGFLFWNENMHAPRLRGIYACYQISSFISILRSEMKDETWNAAAFAAFAATRATRAAPAAIRAADFATRAAVAAATDAATAYAYAYAAAADAAYAYAAAADAADAASAAAARAAMEADLRFVKAIPASLPPDQRAYALHALPLWPQGMPAEIEKLWANFQADALALDPRFQIWLDWYRDRLDGKPFNLDAEREWTMFLGKHPDEFPPAPAVAPEPPSEPDAPPEVAPQEPGLQFAPQADGRISMRPSGLAEADDLAEIAAMRPPLIAVVDELITALQGSNAHASFVSVAQRYKAVLEADALSIDQFFAYGVRLENARHRLEKEVATGDYPDMHLTAGEMLDSVLALHGVVIASTTRGQVLLERARAYQQKQTDIAAYKAKAEALARAVGAAKEAVAEDARTVLEDVNAEIDTGPHPERSTEVARTANQNFLSAAGKAVVSFLGLCAVGVCTDVAKETMREGIAPAALALWTFFITNAPMLREMSVIAGFEISWLPAFLNWLELQRVKRGLPPGDKP